jgi:hypothetical protein
MPKRARESFGSSPSGKRVRKGQASQWSLFPSLESAGLEPVPIQGDGNCFFRAVADQFYGDQNGHRDLRDRAVYFMIHRRQQFEPFMAPEVQPFRSCRKINCNFPNVSRENAKDHFREYLVKMFQCGEWATHLEVQAIAGSLGLEIHIHLLGQEMAQLIKGNLEGRERQLQRIDICFDNVAKHYWSTRPVIQEDNTTEQLMLMGCPIVEQTVLKKDVADEHIMLNGSETEVDWDCFVNFDA